MKLTPERNVFLCDLVREKVRFATGGFGPLTKPGSAPAKVAILAQILASDVLCRARVVEELASRQYKNKTNIHCTGILC